MERYESMKNFESVAVGEKTEFKAPPQCRVLLLNDDYTTMEFVVFILKTVFRHSEYKAEMIMQDVHMHGKGIAGVYVQDIAMTKAQQVEQIARAEGFPLRCEVQSN